MSKTLWAHLGQASLNDHSLHRSGIYFLIIEKSEKNDIYIDAIHTVRIQTHVIDLKTQSQEVSQCYLEIKRRDHKISWQIDHPLTRINHFNYTVINHI